MKDLNPVDNNKIDLFEIFQIIWNRKWTIIVSTIFAFLIGFYYASSQPVFYKVTTPIQSGKTSVFIDYTSINDVLQENKLLLSDENLDGYEVNASTIFQIFISEFNDYNEMIDVLGNNAIVTSNLKDLFNKSLINKISYKLVEKDLKKLKDQVNPDIYNGATLIGLNGISVKSHGNANPLAFSYALKQCHNFITNDLNKKIIESIKNK